MTPPITMILESKDNNDCLLPLTWFTVAKFDLPCFIGLRLLIVFVRISYLITWLVQTLWSSSICSPPIARSQFYWLKIYSCLVVDIYSPCIFPLFVLPKESICKLLVSTITWHLQDSSVHAEWTLCSYWDRCCASQISK